MTGTPCGSGGGGDKTPEPDVSARFLSMPTRSTERLACSSDRPPLQEWSISLNLKVNLDFFKNFKECPALKNGHLENALHFIGHDSIPCVKAKAEQNRKVLCRYWVVCPVTNHKCPFDSFTKYFICEKEVEKIKKKI